MDLVRSCVWQTTYLKWQTFTGYDTQTFQPHFFHTCHAYSKPLTSTIFIPLSLTLILVSGDKDSRKQKLLVSLSHTLFNQSVEFFFEVSEQFKYTLIFGTIF